MFAFAFVCAQCGAKLDYTEDAPKGEGIPHLKYLERNRGYKVCIKPCEFCFKEDINLLKTINERLNEVLPNDRGDL